MAVMQTRKIRYGIIGFGLFAERAIAGAIQSSPNSTLVAVQKRSLTAAREKAKALSLPHAFSSAEELAACPDVDAVFIVSANSAHHDETIAAARAGKHVLVEKPMAINALEARRMIEECERNHVKLMVGHVVRFSPVVRRLRDLVQSGSLGRIVSARADYLFDARLSKRSWLFDRVLAGGGPIFDIGVHCLDTLCYVLDDQVRTVQSQLSPLPTSIATERNAILGLGFSKGTLASITCSFEAPTRHIFIEVIGTEGLASSHDFTLSESRITLDVIRKTNGSATRKESADFDVPNLYIEEVTSFSQCILDGTESPVPGSAGLQHQKVLDAAMEGGGKIS
ncbi:MAG: Gfo/Idh/MocA family oxidoreductase [Ignavibacteria bacterium]|nr:Gfo/Idh/MocA family oxidoreductase [Ignavibacteria bacterium]